MDYHYQHNFYYYNYDDDDYNDSDDDNGDDDSDDDGKNDHNEKREPDSLSTYWLNRFLAHHVPLLIVSLSLRL